MTARSGSSKSASNTCPSKPTSPTSGPVLCAPIGGPRETRWGRPAGERLDFFDAKGAVKGSSSARHRRHIRGETRLTGCFRRPRRGDHAREDRDRRGRAGSPGDRGAFDIAEPVFLVELWIEPMVAALPERPPTSRLRSSRKCGRTSHPVDEAPPPAVSCASPGAIAQAASAWKPMSSTNIAAQACPAGKKSLALRLRYQAPDRTLRTTT